MHELRERFVDALHTLHADRDPGPMSELFADDATLSKAGIEHTERGKDGARSFWQEYRDVFGDIEVDFTHVTENEESAALEWTSQGSLARGGDFTYDGVSVLDGDGSVITGFRTYYDSAAFLREGATP